MTRPRAFTLLGVSTVSMAILTLEVVLTRVFSVFMSYHFAFLAISLALLGTGAAGAWLCVAPRLFPAEKASDRLALLASVFSFTVVVTFFVYLQIPADFQFIRGASASWSNIGLMALVYVTLSVPFLLGGATIVLSISHFSRSVGTVYFFDLAGASLGCLASVAALTLMGGANSVLFVAVIGAVGSLLFALDARPHSKRLAGATVVILSALLVSSLAGGWLQIGVREHAQSRGPIVFDEWNAQARITVHEAPETGTPFSWGLSRTFSGPTPGHLLILNDGKAGTPLHRWDGTPESIDFLRFDLTSIAYRILPDASSYVIGAGGGRDVLTGLLFGARSVRGAEVNPSTIDAVRNTFGEYSGNVYDHPKVRIDNEDARTNLSRSTEQFDLIQASLVDTYAMSSSGAYALTENGLYTIDAFRTYYKRLSSRGIVSYSRWYVEREPAETLRLLAMGLSAWKEAGSVRPSDHVVVIVTSPPAAVQRGLATMLLKKSPFTSDEVDVLTRTAEELGFRVLHAPGYAVDDSAVHRLAEASDLELAIAEYPLDISVPTDDRPFYFNFLRFTELGRFADKENPVYRSSARANMLLLSVFGISTAAAALFILGPLAVRRREALSLPDHWPWLVYFAAIGFGFMLVMIPSIQRLSIYLGSPTYALAVVLFTILLSSGIGSLTTRTVSPGDVASRLRKVIPALIAVIAIHLPLVPIVARATQSWPLAARIGVVVALIFPAGFLMGQPFPSGIRSASARSNAVVPWLWAVNGTTSVSGSALAAVLSISFGFRAVLVAGMACYALALGAALYGLSSKSFRYSP